MKKLTWKQREELIPDYEIHQSYTKEEIGESFLAIKGIAINHYNLKSLNDEEIEEALFNLYLIELESMKEELEKIIFLDYADNFLSKIKNPLLTMLQMIKPNTEFRDNQNLFKTRHELLKINQNITEDSFNKYFCSLENGSLFNRITNETKPLEEDFLEELKDKEDDLFEENSQIDPNIRAKHYLNQRNYDPEYWNSYFNYVENKRQILLEYFTENNKLEELEDFRDIANIYYLYASWYKIVNKSKRKGKTI